MYFICGADECGIRLSDRDRIWMGATSDRLVESKEEIAEAS
jgi:hypothetical protein